MALSFFKKTKTYLERNPGAKKVYEAMTPAQREVLDGISYEEQSHASADKKKALDRITEVMVELYPAEKASQIKTRAKDVHARALLWLQQSELTTNVEVAKVLNPAFLAADNLKTVWNIKTAKGFKYESKRQRVEENALGYKIDWRVPLREAANLRPVYAGLNYSRHPSGAAPSYGSIALVLKPTVMQRCTFIQKDTFDTEFDFADATGDALAAARAKICTSAQFGTLIANMSNSQIRALCKCVLGKYTMTDDVPNYVEAHIHGGVQFAKDLRAIRIATTGQSTFDKERVLAAKTNSAYSDRTAVEAAIRTFAQRFGVPAQFYNRDLPGRIIA